jgi:predicted ester cyclase
VATAYFEAIAAHDLEGMKASWEPDGVDDLHGLVELRGPDAIAKWFGAMFAALPNFRIEVLDALESGDKVAIHWRITGTFDGEGRFQDMLPTGAELDITGCDVLTVHEGKIQRNDAYVNGMQMAQQLGAMPPTDSRQEKLMIGAINVRTRFLRLLKGR